MTDPFRGTIETARLTLEPMRIDDADDLYAIMRDPAVGAPMGELPPESVDVMRARIASWMAGPEPASSERWLNWLARTREGRPVGHLSATVRVEVAWLAWVVGVEHQRRGYATEAASGMRDHLAANGISTFAATILPGHLASEGVARNLALALTDEVVDGERVWRSVG
jgi:RimJ/RimL family protein N-acetyltransferase